MGHRTIPPPFPKPRDRNQCRDLATDYFNFLEAEGHNLDDYRWMLRAPEVVSINDLCQLCQQHEIELIELLQHGLGGENSFNTVDNAVSRQGSGYALGVVTHIA